MPRQEGRESDSRRPRSRYDREPSPKRYRRENERRNENSTKETRFDKDEDYNNKLVENLSDPLDPLPESKTGAVDKDAQNKNDEHHELTKHSADPSKAERSRKYFQHDDRGGVGQSGRSIGRQSDRDSGPWRNSRYHLNDRSETYSGRRTDTYERNNKDNGVWKHDGYFEMDANPKPIVSKRPAFREQKIQREPLEEKSRADPVARNLHAHSVEAGRKDQRWHSSERSYRPERSLARETQMNRGEPWDDRLNGSRFRGQEKFQPQRGSRATGGVADKWKHDLYDEASKSPRPKNEEDQISKIEALLAS